MIPRKRRFSKVLLLFLSLAFAFGITEAGMRIFLKQPLSLREDERNLNYRYDPELGWFPVENSRQTYPGNRTVVARHNSRGFRDPEHVVDDRPGIVFLGDSFVWGYDVEETERFTERLREKFGRWSVYNLGVSGYGTDQEFLLLKKHIDFYKPSVVFLVFCTHNDRGDNSSNVRYGGYHKPYFVAREGGLELRGIPVPRSENYFFARHRTLSNLYWVRLLAKAYFKIAGPASKTRKDPTRDILAAMNDLVGRSGAEFIVGFVAPCPEVERFLDEKKIPRVDLSHSHRYPRLGKHWTPEGHTLVSGRIHEFLVKGKYEERALQRDQTVSGTRDGAAPSPP